MPEFIDVFDENENIISVKERNELNKRKDIFKAVHVLVFDTFGKVYLSVISRTGDFLWKGTWGATCAGIVKHGEDSEFTAMRTMEEELGITEEVELVGAKYFDLGDAKRIITLYTCTTTKKMTPNPLDIERIQLFDRQEVEELIIEKRTAPSLAACWEMLKEK